MQPTDGVEPSPELEATLLAWCRERLARVKVPRSIDFVAELPRLPTGKVQKHKLREPYWEGHESRPCDASTWRRSHEH